MCVFFCYTFIVLCKYFEKSLKKKCHSIQTIYSYGDVKRLYHKNRACIWKKKNQIRSQECKHLVYSLHESSYKLMTFFYWGENLLYRRCKKLLDEKMMKHSLTLRYYYSTRSVNLNPLIANLKYHCLLYLY
jgi:hypothetical protein